MSIKLLCKQSLSLSVSRSVRVLGRIYTQDIYSDIFFLLPFYDTNVKQWRRETWTFLVCPWRRNSCSYIVELEKLTHILATNNPPKKFTTPIYICFSFFDHFHKQYLWAFLSSFSMRIYTLVDIDLEMLISKGFYEMIWLLIQSAPPIFLAHARPTQKINFTLQTILSNNRVSRKVGHWQYLKTNKKWGLLNHWVRAKHKCLGTIKVCI